MEWQPSEVSERNFLHGVSGAKPEIMKHIILLSLLFLPNLVFASESFNWCGDGRGRIYKCYPNPDTGKLEIPEIDLLIQNLFPEPGLAEKMTKIAKCESNLKQSARGALGEIGVFQVMPFHQVTASKYGLDVRKIGDNVIYSRFLYDKSGFKPWTCARIVGIL